MSQIVQDEEARLDALAEYDFSAGQPDETCRRLVNLAAGIFAVPIVTIAIVERHRQIYHCQIGLALTEIDRNASFCSIALAQRSPLVVLDASRDERFRANPLVTGSPHIRFYAGVPLRAPGGHLIGTLCLIDHRPRARFDAQDLRHLEDLAALVIDKFELRRLARAGEASRRRFERMAESSPDGMSILDDQGRHLFWNSGAQRIFGYATDEMDGLAARDLLPDHLRYPVGGFEAAFADSLGATQEIVVLTKDGTSKVVEFSLSRWREEGRTVYGSVFRDVSDRRAVEARMYRLAHYDGLTELPNRTLLRQRIEATLAEHRPCAVLMLDLDGFKDVNDSLGHAAGDAVLQATARRLMTSVPAGATVGRLGGDEFAILLADMAEPEAAAQVAERVIRVLSQPFLVDDHALNLGASIGIALSPLHTDRADDLLAHADMAQYQSKRDGRNCYHLFTHALRGAAVRWIARRQEAPAALEAGDFELFYQPQVRLCDHRLVGAEALIRWRHPQLGLLAPADFLSAIERSSLAARIGTWVLRTACAQAAAWREAGGSDFRVGVNLFGAQFRDGDLTCQVERALGDFGLPPSALELEITENIILRHDEALVAPLREIRARGIGLAFDDYGTGYASLSLLKRFPLTRLKIDRSFVHAMASSKEDAAIIRMILKLGQSFGLAVVAEGVERRAQHRSLKAQGCAEGQGYLYGKPMPAADFAALFGLDRPALTTTRDAA